MKLKLTLMAVAATLALGYQAQASSFIGTVTNYSKLNISFVLTTNTPEVSHGDFSKVGHTKVTGNNKTLLTLLEGPSFYDGTFPEGAQLVIGFDSEWDGDVLVVDKTGTNVIFDAYVNSTENLEVDLYDEDGASDWTENDPSSAPGFYDSTEYNVIYFQFYDSNSNTYLWGQGNGQVRFTENWSSTVWTKWSNSDSAPLDGAQTYVNDSDYMTFNGQLTASGHGNGYNSWADHN